MRTIKLIVVVLLHFGTAFGAATMYHKGQYGYAVFLSLMWVFMYRVVQHQFDRYNGR